MVVVAGIVLVALLDLADRGVDVIGRIEGAVPAPAIPAVAWSDLAALLPGAMAIAVIGYAETATVAESLAEEHRYHVRPDRELVATGAANLLSGLFRGFITGGGASSSMLDHLPGTRPGPGLLVFRLNAPLLFINAKLLRDRVRARLEDADPPVRLVLGDLQFSHQLDVESINALGSLRRDLHERGVELWMANVHADVLALLRRSGLAAELAQAHLYRTLEEAVPDVRAALAP